MITVLGASGFIGSNLVQKLDSLGLRYDCPGRSEPLTGRDLGTVIYCIGLTADWRERPLDAVDAHVCHLTRLLQTCEFASLVYLSSTRLYLSGEGLACEDSPIQVNPSVPNELFNISKAMGESALLSSGKRGCAVRLSNVYGGDFDSQNFLSAVLRDVVTQGSVTLQTSIESAKDYISIDDVTDMLVKIAIQGKEQLYNLASGENISNGQIIDAVQRLTGCEVKWSKDAATVGFPPISIRKVQEEFGFSPSRLLGNMESLVNDFQRHCS